MKTFNEFMQNKTISCMAQDIVDTLTIQSEYIDPIESLDAIFLERFGKSNHYFFVEAFDGQSGGWGNLWNGVKSGAKWLGGKALQGIGGLAGGVAGTVGGGIAGAMGQNPNQLGSMGGTAAGAATGSKPGANIAQSGAGGVQNALNNSQQASMVSAYRKSVAGLDAYIQAVQKMPQVQTIAGELGKIKRNLEAISSRIEAGLNGSIPAPAPAGAGTPAGTPAPATGTVPFPTAPTRVYPIGTGTTP